VDFVTLKEENRRLVNLVNYRPQNPIFTPNKFDVQR